MARRREATYILDSNHTKPIIRLSRAAILNERQNIANLLVTRLAILSQLEKHRRHARTLATQAAAKLGTRSSVRVDKWVEGSTARSSLNCKRVVLDNGAKGLGIASSADGQAAHLGRRSDLDAVAAGVVHLCERRLPDPGQGLLVRRVLSADNGLVTGVSKARGGSLGAASLRLELLGFVLFLGNRRSLLGIAVFGQICSWHLHDLGWATAAITALGVEVIVTAVVGTSVDTVSRLGVGLSST